TKSISSSISAASSMVPNTELLKLIKSQLQSGIDPRFDFRTNTVFSRETRSNIDNIRKMLVQIDKPTKQVMIEARLVEVSADPVQAYGINWAGTVGSATNPKTVTYGQAIPGASPQPGQNPPTSGFGLGSGPTNNNFFGNLSHLVPGQFAILTAPQFSAALTALNA